MKAKEILRYFVRHPQAADTLEGVARWRLLEESIQRNVEEIEAALRWLVARRFLLVDSTVGTAGLFQVNRDKLAEAERLLGRPTRGRTDRPPE